MEFGVRGWEFGIINDRVQISTFELGVKEKYLERGKIYSIEKDMEIKELLQEKRAEILKIAAQYGASNIRIFGSVARGEATADSDIDFLMDIQAGRSLLNRIALIQDLEDLLDRKVDVAKPEILHECIREQILKEAIPL